MGRCASPSRPAPILQQSLTSPFPRGNVSTSRPHQRLSLSNPRESRRKPPQASAAIPHPSGTAARDHQPLPVPFQKRGHGRSAGGDVQGTGPLSDPRNWNWHPVFIIYRSPLPAEPQPERDGRSGIESLTWAAEFGVCLLGSPPSSDGTSQSPEIPIPGSFPKIPGQGSAIATPVPGPVVEVPSGQAPAPPSIHPLGGPTCPIPHHSGFSPPNLAGTTFIYIFIKHYHFRNISKYGGGGEDDDFYTLL